MAQTSYKKTGRATALILLTSAMWLAGTGYGEAQVQTDITKTLPPVGDHADLRLGTEVTAPPQSGHTWTITGGTRAGNNLFHSFETFSVGKGDIANFSPGPKDGGITDIFSRVTGGNPSNIDGTIRTADFVNANLWFMNPNGILFGPNAQLNIGGSAIFTTANSLTFSDIFFSTLFNKFEANDQSTPLSIAHVTSFGFVFPLSDGPPLSPSEINVLGSTLAVHSGNTLSLAGGNINIVGGTLKAPDGHVRLTSVAAPPISSGCGTVCGVDVNVDKTLAIFTPIFGNNEGAILLAQAPGGKDAILDTGSAGTIQINGFDYQGTNTRSFNLFTAPDTDPRVPAIVLSNGGIAVGNVSQTVTPVDSYRVANLPKTNLTVSTPAVTSLLSPTSTDIGDTGNVTVTLNHPFTNLVGVDVSSNQTGVASAPGHVDIPAGKDTATTQFRGIAPGKATITAQVKTIQSDDGEISFDIPDAGRSLDVQVVFPPSNVTPPQTSLVEGSGGTVTVSIARPVKQDVTIALSSSNTNILTLQQPTAVIPAGKTSVDVPYATSTALLGDATVTATLQTGGQSVGNLLSTTIHITPDPITTLTPNQTLDVGQQGTLTVTLGQKAPHPIQIDFRSSDPNAVTAPGSIIIPVGQTTATVPVTGAHNGTTTITAAYAGDTAVATVLVTLPLDNQLTATPVTLIEGSRGTLTVTLTRAATQDTTVTLASSAPGILAPQLTTVTIPKGQITVTVPYTTTQFGEATVTASLQSAGGQPVGTPHSTHITVTPDPITTLTPNQTLDEGKSGTLLVTLGQPAPHPITVNLTSSDPNAVQVPTQITIAKDQSTATVPVTGAHVGAATITAAYAGDTAAAAIQVVLTTLPSQLAPTPLTLVEGSGGTVTITLSKPSTQPVTVALTSSNPGVLTPQATVIIPANQITTTVPYLTKQFGDATVTAALQVGGRAIGTTTSAPIHVTPDPITTLTPNRTLDEGKSSTLIVTLGQPAPHPIQINFTSSNPNAVAAPGAITIPLGQTTATVPVTAVHNGTATITAAYAGDTAVATVLVNLPLDNQLSATPVTLVEGSGGTLTVTLTRPTTQATTVTLTSSAPGVLTPQQTTVTIPANQTTVTIPYLTKQFGDATVTATLQASGQPVGTPHSTLIHVTPDPITTLTPNRTLDEGKSSTLIVTLGQPAPHPIQVTFTSSNPNAVAAPGAITIPLGQTTATVPVTAAHNGTTTITAIYAGDTAVATVLVNLPLDNQLAATPVTLVEGSGGTLTVTLTRPTTQPTTVTLTSSAPGVLTPRQTTVTIPANQTTVTIPYVTKQFGDATVTASVQSAGQPVGTPHSTLIHVTPDPITTLTPNRALEEGAPSTLLVTLGQPAPHPIQINFRSSDPNAVPAPGAITIPLGQTTATVPILGAHSGTATITATYAGDTATAAIQVVLTTLPSQLVPTPVTLVEGNGGTVTLTLSKPTAQPVTVALTSSDPGVLTPQATVTIPANQTIVTVPYATQQFGDATVTALLQVGGRAVGAATSAPIHVTPDPITIVTPTRTLDEGTNSTVTVTLGHPAVHATTITFTSSNPSAIPAPGPVTIPLGQSTATVPVTAIRSGSATITAAYASVTAVASVLVNQIGTSIANIGGQSLTSLAVTTRTPKDPPAMQPAPVPAGSQLVIAGRCAAGAKGEFSSFVQRGRDASPASPGGPLASPPILDDTVPRISSISVQPGTVTLQASHSLQLAPGISPFLARNGGC